MDGSRTQLTDVQNLLLHEEITIDSFTNALRVPGGLIYTFRSSMIGKEDYYSSTFVPFTRFRKSDND